MLLNNVEVTGVNSDVKGTLGVIIPFRYSRDRIDDIERIERIFSVKKPEEVLFYFVDSGSPYNESMKLRELCIKYKVEYIYVDSKNEMFSAGKARDIGAIYAKTEFLFFQDVDLLPYNGFYEELLLEIKIQNLPEKQNDFIMIPCFYLTKSGSLEYIDTDPDRRKSIFTEYYFKGDKLRIHNFAPGSSAIVVHRLHYLSIGGHRKEFRGHGFEDFELIHRLSALSNKFYRPFQYYSDKKNWHYTEYKGFRSMFRLFGDISFIKGMFICHMWHPPYIIESAFRLQNKNNATLLIESMKSFDNNHKHPEPLPDIYMGKTIALGDANSAFYKSIWKVMPSFGLVDYKSEHSFETPSALIDYIDSNGYDCVLMPNPYGNEKRLSLYRELRLKNKRYIVSDRGALPDSVFFDSNGFNADSSSYRKEVWDIPLTETQLQEIELYIRTEQYTDDALEKQGVRKGADFLAEKLHISPTKKVLFVPFQRPSDTVIKYFSGSVSDMNDFITFVEKVAENLDDEWVILAKKHPLESTRPLSERINFVEDNTHIKDLIEISDAVLLINSGVGVLSMIWGKPVLYVGEVFYGHDKINKKVSTPEEAIEILKTGIFKVDDETVKRFLYYLINRFYSFGKTRSELVKQPDGSLFNVTRDIMFYKINIPGCMTRKMISRDMPEIALTSPIFDRYRVYLNNVKSNQTNKSEIQPKKTQTNNLVIAQNKTTMNNEPFIIWCARQLYKLFTNPRKFKVDFRGWVRRKKKRARLVNS
ncbi:CDP-glycerol glycerophosphotransferase family protein [Paenibacillus tarimensis]